jgi:hypothetical protein
VKQNKFYYYDEKNDLVEYLESDESVFAVWVNPYLTLMFPHGCAELNPKNAIGFQINGMKHLLSKAKEQADAPLTEEQEKRMEKVFTESGWKSSVNEDGEKIWSLE